MQLKVRLGIGLDGIGKVNVKVENDVSKVNRGEGRKKNLDPIKNRLKKKSCTLKQD